MHIHSRHGGGEWGDTHSEGASGEGREGGCTSKTASPPVGLQFLILSDTIHTSIYVYSEHGEQLISRVIRQQELIFLM